MTPRTSARTAPHSLTRRTVLAGLLLALTWLGAAARRAEAGTPPAGAALVRLLPGVDLNQVTGLIRRLGLNVRWTDGAARLLVVDSPRLPVSGVIGLLQFTSGLLGIQTVEQNLLCALSGRYGGSQSQAAICSDELVFSSMPLQPALATVGANTPPSGPGPVVAVLDGGFSLGHEALAPGAVIGTYDTFDGDAAIEDQGDGFDGDGDGVADDLVGHGTATAALLSVTAPSARLYLVRVLDDEGVGSFATLASGLDAALRAGAQVVNISAGAAQSSQILENMLHDAAVRGVAVICAAGNDAGAVAYPARSAYAYAVAGCDADRRWDPASNFGASVDLGAPSVSVIAPAPRTTDRYAYWFGTSFAAPITAGCVAQLLTAGGGGGRAALQRLLGCLQPWAEIHPGQGQGLADLRPLRTW